MRGLDTHFEFVYPYVLEKKRPPAALREPSRGPSRGPCGGPAGGRTSPTAISRAERYQHYVYHHKQLTLSIAAMKLDDNIRNISDMDSNTVSIAYKHDKIICKSICVSLVVTTVFHAATTYSDWGVQLRSGTMDRTGDDAVAPHERRFREKRRMGFGGGIPLATERDDGPIRSPITPEHTAILRGNQENYQALAGDGAAGMCQVGLRTRRTSLVAATKLQVTRECVVYVCERPRG